VPQSIAGLAARFAPASAIVVDVDELVAAMEATGVSDRQAQQRYGVPTVFALGEAVLAHVWATRPRVRPPDPAPARRPVVRPALARSLLLLTPALAAWAAAPLLGRVGWPLLAGTLLVAWAGGQALARAGHARAAEGTAAVLRPLASGLAVALALAALLVAMSGRPVEAYGACAAVLVNAAGTAGALVAGRVAAVLRWSVPLWLVSAGLLTGAVPAALTWLLGVAVALAAARAFAPAPRQRAGADRWVPDTPVPAGAIAGHLVAGAGQAGALLLVWWLGPGPAGVLPVLAGLPLVEVFVAWHAARAAAGLDAYDDVAAYRRHLRGIGTLTLAALAPPLAVGLALVVAAFRLPYHLSRHPDARGLVLAFAAGVLLCGAYAVTLLLTSRGRLVLAALVAVAPVGFAALAALGWLVAVPGGGAGSLVTVMLPATVAGLAATYVLGLVATAHTVFHPGS